MAMKLFPFYKRVDECAGVQYFTNERIAYFYERPALLWMQGYTEVLPLCEGDISGTDRYVNTAAEGTV